MTLTQTKQVYEISHTLTYYECTDTGHPSMSMLLSMMTMVSDMHLEFMGLDTATVHKTGGAWVVTGYDGTFSPTQPVYGQQVVLGTKAVAYNRFFALREFWMTDRERKHEYVHLRALFVFMNLKKRRLMSIPPQLIEIFGSPLVKRLPRLHQPAAIEGRALRELPYRVRYFDIDVNHHVNNARYFDWLLDPLGSRFLRTHQFVKMAIKYLHEVRETMTVASSYQVQEKDTEIITRHEIRVEGRVCAQAEIVWNKIK